MLVDPIDSSVHVLSELLEVFPQPIYGACPDDQFQDQFQDQF